MSRKLAEGGIVSGPTNHTEGKEAVIPISSLGRTEFIALVNQIKADQNHRNDAIRYAKIPDFRRQEIEDIDHVEVTDNLPLTVSGSGDGLA